MQTMIQRYPSKLTVVTIFNPGNDPEFQRIDEKEFRYKGRMYDVLHETKTGGTTVFICLPDAKESLLFAGLKRVNQNKLHLALWDQVVLILLSQPSCDYSPSYTNTLIFPRIDITLKSSMLPTWSPPPELS